MNKLKAYTVAELIVVMIVSSLAIGISYTCYVVFSKQYSAYKKNAEALSVFSLTDKLLSGDIANCRKVERTLEGMVCKKPKINVYYEFYPGYILRRASIIDTFHIPTQESVLMKRSGHANDIPGDLIDEVSFETPYKDQVLKFNYKKNYGADVVINSDQSKN